MKFPFPPSPALRRLWGELEMREGKRRPATVEVTFHRQGAISVTEKHREREEFRRICHQQTYLLNQDMGYFFLHLRMHLRSWWD